MHSEFPGKEKSKTKKDGETKRSRGRPPLPKGLRCEKCNTTDTPEWRVGENGPHTLCNACGLQYAKKKKVEIESKAKHSIKNILNDSEPAPDTVEEAVQRGQQDFLIHNATYGKTGVPSYHANKNKRPSAIAINSPAGSPMVTRATSGGSSPSPMAFTPSSPFNIPSYFSAMTLSSPSSTPGSTPPPPSFCGPPTPSSGTPRMSPFNPAAQSPGTTTTSTFPYASSPFSDQHPYFTSGDGGKISPTPLISYSSSPSPSSSPYFPSDKLTQMETATVLSSFSSHSPRSTSPFILGLPEKPMDKHSGPNMPHYTVGFTLPPPSHGPNYSGPNFSKNHPIFSSNHNSPLSSSPSFAFSTSSSTTSSPSSSLSSSPSFF